MLCHNGEINALWGNERRMRGRAELGTEAVGLGPEELFRPVLDEHDSDSGKLDAAVELLMRAGRDPRHVMAMLVPEAWENVRDLDPEVRGFYRYHSALMEPWDGPAGIVFTDGIGVGARLDRNGLRPLRYQVCEDGFVAVLLRGRRHRRPRSRQGAARAARPGPDAVRRPDPWLPRRHRVQGTHRGRCAVRPVGRRRLLPAGRRRGRAPACPTTSSPARPCTGYTKEELAMVLKPMANDAHEPTFSMGDDSPLPNLAPRARPVSHYLRQRFAQVTNPPIDPLRERLVMSLRTVLGPRQPLLTESAEAAELLTLDSFFLYPSGVDALELTDKAPWPVIPLDATFPAADGPGGLRAAVDRLVAEAIAAVEGGAGILILDGVRGRVRPGPRARRCWRRERSTRPSPSAGCGRTRPSWSWPTTCSTSTPSPRCSATAPTPSARPWRWPPWRARPTRPTTATSRAPRRRAATRPRSRPAC